MNETDRPPWAEPPVTPITGSGPGGRETDNASAPWADPPELVAVRAGVREAQERIARATRQLELASELEARLETLLEERSGQGVPPVASPERHAAELEATGIILKAELRAAKILNDTGDPDRPSAYTPAGIERGTASALEGYIAQLADIETMLAAIGGQFVRDAIAGEPGPSRIALDGNPSRRRARPVGQSVPVPLFRRPRRGKSE